MPLLSFVLVLHREQAYLEPFAASVLDQGGVDLELLVVDDASPDHGPQLADALAARDPRVRVIHLAQRAGLGPARNRALDEVAGDHVWFVNATDLLAEGALRAIADRLVQDEPDVLVVDHAHVDRAGRRRASVDGKLLGRVFAEGVGPLDGRKRLADLPPHVWNRTLRTAHLRAIEARFGDAGHSGLTVAWPALATAERIGVAPLPAYVRREPPNAVLEPATPADALDQHAAVWARLAALDVPPARAALVTRALLREELGLLARAPEAERRAIFHRVGEHRRAHGEGDLGGLPALQERMLERDRYDGFRAVGASLRAYRAARRRGGAVVRRARAAKAKAEGKELDRFYRSRLRQPIDPDLAVFAAYWNRGYACNPRAIYERARELVPSMRGVWVVEAKAAAKMPDGVEHVVAGSREYFDAIARARFFVNNINFPNHLVKRPEQIHVMTHHGTPLKRMGLDIPRVAGRKDNSALLRRCSRWDYSVSSNAFSTLIWERAYPTRYETLEVGYPRNDVLATATAEDVARIRDELGLAPGERAVLYAPTHREYQPDWVPTLDVAALADGLGEGWVLLDRRHYFMGSDPRLEGLRRRGRVRDVSDHPRVEDLCLAADALITDYSSIMFDYAVVDRPIVIHAPDWEVYKTMRGTYFDLLAEPPGVVTRTTAEAIEAFTSGAIGDATATAARAAFRARFCALDDGHAGERVVRRVWLGEPAVAR